VTGAAGFLGRHLVARLLGDGVDVHGVSRIPRLMPAEVRWHQSAFDEASEIDRLLRSIRPDVVFHLAGQVTSAFEIDRIASTFTSLLASTVHLLTSATRLGVERVVLAGSFTEPEERGEAAVSPYAAAKACASLYARTFHALYRTPVVVVRIFMTYGPGQRPSQLVPHAIASLLQKRAPRLSDGSYAADWIYVDDVIEGLLRAARRPTLCGRTVELGTGRLTTVREVAERIAALLDIRTPLRFGDRPEGTHPVRPAADVAATRALLDWHPTITLDDGLGRTIAWLRQGLEAS
jgi:nucleoside-diphosphate-sugar epimerase